MTTHLLHLDRVAYTPERLKQLGAWAALKNSVFMEEDRMGLVSDAVILAKAGLGKTSAALDLIETFSGETESKPKPELGFEFFSNEHFDDVVPSIQI
jgi:hypothetical protein